MTALGEHLEDVRSRARKILVPYVMACAPDAASWTRALSAIAEHADAIEIGLPYSDPLMDGPVIAAAGERALAAGIGPLEALDGAARAEVAVPRLVMTYYNPIYRLGELEFCRRAARAGISGLIVPDVPLEESGDLRRAAAEVGLGWVPLVAPTSPPARVRALVAGATAFVYAVSTLGVTGTRRELSERAARVVDRCREATDQPILVGIGISTPEQARAAAAVADGVVIGSAVVKAVMERGPAAARELLGEVRAALDAAPV